MPFPHARVRIAGKMAFRRDLPREDRIHVSSCLCRLIVQSNEDSGQTYFRSVLRQRMLHIQFSLFCFQPGFFSFSVSISFISSLNRRIPPLTYKARKAIVASKVALVGNNIRKDGMLVRLCLAAKP